MEKILEKKSFKSRIQKILPKQIQKIKVFEHLDEAFKNFDEMQEDDKVPFVIKDIPLVPDEKTAAKYLLQNSLLLIDNGEFSMARHILGDLLRRDSHHADAIRWMGWCFKQEGDLKNAQKCYEQLINIRKSDQDFFELGEIYYEQKDDQKAKEVWIAALNYCVAESPRLFDLHKNLGNAFLRLGDLESAEENYNKALTLRPQSDALQVNLGSMHFYRRDMHNSFECFKKAIDLNPYNDRAWCGVALVAREKGDKDWAYSMVLKSLDINGENLIALQTLVGWAMEDERYQEAIDRSQLYAYKNQFDHHMIYTLAGLLFKSGDYLGCEIELEKLLSMNPKNESALQLLQLLEVKQNEQA